MTYPILHPSYGHKLDQHSDLIIADPVTLQQKRILVKKHYEVIFEELNRMMMCFIHKHYQYIFELGS